MREQLKHLPEEKLTRFQFTPEEFRKVQVEDHEIKVASKMYDIARVIKQGNSIVVFTLHDEAEDSLLAFLDEMASRSTDDKKPVPIQVEQLLTLNFLLVPSINLHNNYSEIYHNTPYYPVVSKIFFAIASPPPRS
jgi:hypothetical protein